MTNILEKVKRKIEQLNQRIEIRKGENYHDESKKVLILGERLGVYEELLPEIASLITTIESLQAENKELLASEMAVNYQNEILANEDLKQQIESQKEEIETLKWKIAHPVSCSGICTSQLDDYCGMHMSNQDCIACNSIWTNAHVENAVFNEKAITDLAVKALEWYANDKNWKLGVNISMGSAFPLHEAIKSDKGERAQSTIEEIKRRNHAK